jgi:hypothetical protein
MLSSPPPYSTTKDPPFWPARQMSRFNASDDIGTFSPPLSLAQLSLELHISSRAQTTQRNPDYRRAPRIRSFRETAVAHFQIAINFSKSGCVRSPDDSSSKIDTFSRALQIFRDYLDSRTGTVRYHTEFRENSSVHESSGIVSEGDRF